MNHKFNLLLTPSLVDFTPIHALILVTLSTLKPLTDSGVTPGVNEPERKRRLRRLLKLKLLFQADILKKLYHGEKKISNVKNPCELGGQVHFYKNTFFSRRPKKYLSEVFGDQLTSNQLVNTEQRRDSQQ